MTNEKNPSEMIYSVLKPQIGDVLYLAIDYLPAELPKDASEHFSNHLVKFIPQIVQSDPLIKFQEQSLPSEIKKACITSNGELTTTYQYLNEFL